MDLTAVSNLITNVGFPIAMVLGLMWFIYQIFLKTSEENAKNMAQMQERCKDREERLYQEIAKNREVNSKAIDTIAHYAEKLDVIQSDINDIKTNVTVIMTKQ